ncbi:MAG: hypothetical protein Q7S37_01960 [bacterium]|nr:hypothetical protein [bacterium]
MKERAIDKARVLPDAIEVSFQVKFCEYHVGGEDLYTGITVTIARYKTKHNVAFIGASLIYPDQPMIKEVQSGLEALVYQAACTSSDPWEGIATPFTDRGIGLLPGPRTPVIIDTNDIPVKWSSIGDWRAYQYSFGGVAHHIRLINCEFTEWVARVKANMNENLDKLPYFSYLPGGWHVSDCRCIIYSGSMMKRIEDRTRTIRNTPKE